MAAPEVVDAMFKNGLEPSTGTPEHAAAFLKDEIERFSRIIKLGKIRLTN
jgi:tripartite-type tricarboxylate transporter receptor subunit TctC